MAVSALMAGVSGRFTVLKDLGALLLDERDRQKAAAIHVDFTNKVIEAQTPLLQVLGTVIDQQRLIPVLEQRIRDLEAAGAEKERYELAKLGRAREFFVYRPRRPAEGDEGVDQVLHFLCQPCFDAGKKAVLVGNGSGYWACPICRHGAQVEPVDETVRSFGRRNWRGF